MLPPVPERAPAALPRRFGKYTLLQPLGKGGMASVFIARKDGAKQVCVLKQLHAEVEAKGSAGRRFYREAHLASLLAHPNIAKVIDAGFVDRSFFMAMELVPGKDVEAIHLALLASRRKFPPGLAIYTVLGALEGLAYAHDAAGADGKPLELVHRDLSPRNLMLGFDGGVRVIDFGVARGNVDDFKTAPGMLVGTARYVSPEQAYGRVVDRRSDLYTLAVVLWELLTARPLVPFGGTPAQILEAVVRAAPQPVRAFSPDLPEAIDAVLARALVKEREQRWPDAGAFRDALRSAAAPLSSSEPATAGRLVRALFLEDAKRLEALLGIHGEDDAATMKTRTELLRPEATLGDASPWAVALARLDGQVGDGATDPVRPVDLVAPHEEARTAAAMPTEPGTAAGARTRTGVVFQSSASQLAARPPRTRAAAVLGAVAGGVALAAIAIALLPRPVTVTPAPVAEPPAAPAAAPLIPTAAPLPAPVEPVAAEAPAEPARPAPRQKRVAAPAPAVVAAPAERTDRSVEGLQARVDAVLRRARSARAEHAEGTPERRELDDIVGRLMLLRATPRIDDEAAVRALSARLDAITR